MAATTEEGRLEFKHGHLAGQTGLAFAFGMGEAGEGHATTVVHLLTGGADCLACVRTSESSFKDAETEINDHEDAITCLAANRISVGVVPTTTTTTTFPAAHSHPRDTGRAATSLTHATD
uniref:Uncharacterized protein n=1 Tax=Chloropicon roscoffensis TaxID=1461544 RepID=A0A7S3CA50_9CHLO